MLAHKKTWIEIKKYPDQTTITADQMTMMWNLTEHVKKRLYVFRFYHW